MARITPQELEARLQKAGFRPEPEDQTLRDVVGNGLGKQMQVLEQVLAEDKTLP